MSHAVHVAMSPRASRKGSSTAITGLLDERAYVKIISVTLGEDVNSSTILWSLKVPLMVALHLFPKVPYTTVHEQLISSEASYPRQFLQPAYNEGEYLDFSDEDMTSRDILRKFQQIDEHLEAVMKLHEQLIIHNVSPDIAAYALPISTYVTLEVSTLMSSIMALANVPPPAENEIPSFGEEIFNAMFRLGESHI